MVEELAVVIFPLAVTVIDQFLPDLQAVAGSGIVGDPGRGRQGSETTTRDGAEQQPLAGDGHGFLHDNGVLWTDRERRRPSYRFPRVEEMNVLKRRGRAGVSSRGAMMTT